MEPMHQRVAGIDVHRMKHVVTILIGREDGAVSSETREFGGFKRDMRALVAWLQTHRIQQVVMESTGIYWKSVFGHLEAAGIPALVVNAFHVKNVPGRKTDVGDSEWLAQLARFGLLRGSFIPPKDLRELRIVSRYRRKLTGMLAGEKNRLHKLLGRRRDLGPRPASFDHIEEEARRYNRHRHAIARWADQQEEAGHGLARKVLQLASTG